MRVLITRPCEEATALAALLSERGIESVVAPVMTIRDAAGVAPDLRGTQAMLFTSANGVRAFARRSSEARGLPVFTVGDATAEAARAAGFTEVESASGAVDDLTALVVARLDPTAGALLHASGRDVAGDLPGALGKHGFQVRRSVLYQAEAAERLPDEARTALVSGSLDGALFFSPRSAELFVRLGAREQLTPTLARLAAFCLSEAVAEAAQAAHWRTIMVAPRPDQPALVELVARYSLSHAEFRRG